MKILTKEDARELLKGKTLDTFTAQLSSQLRLVEDAYSAPVSSGVQIALSNLFAYLMLKDSSVCIYVTGWGVSMEHLDLFYGYRRSLGDLRLLMEAPVHVFEPTESEAFVSILAMAFFFSWDVWVFDFAERWLLRTSHDGWFEVRALYEEAIKSVALELEKYRIPLLSQKQDRTTIARVSKKFLSRGFRWKHLQTKRHWKVQVGATILTRGAAAPAIRHSLLNVVRTRLDASFSRAIAVQNPVEMGTFSLQGSSGRGGIDGLTLQGGALRETATIRFSRRKTDKGCSCRFEVYRQRVRISEFDRSVSKTPGHSRHAQPATN